MGWEWVYESELKLSRTKHKTQEVSKYESDGWSGYMQEYTYEMKKFSLGDAAFGVQWHFWFDCSETSSLT